MKTYFVSYIIKSCSTHIFDQIQNEVVVLDDIDLFIQIKDIECSKAGIALFETIKNKLPEDLYSNIKIISINQLS